MKAQDLGAVGTGAFRKEEDRDAGFQHRHHLHSGFLGAAATLAVEEDGPSAARKKAEGGPAANFLLGHKDARSCGRIDQDVEIAEVVGADESLGRTLASAFQV
jgi:hypothetical protein